MAERTHRRRSQEERSAATIARLLDATIQAIAELGYSRASVREICGRAGVSQGGLFRHFATRKDLLVAAAAELHERQLATLRSAFSGGDAHAAVSTLRDVVSDPDTTVWLELCVAARTDADLRDALRPLLAGHRRALRSVAAQLPAFAALSQAAQETWLDIAQRVFQAEALWRHTTPPPDLGPARVDALVALLDVLAESGDAEGLGMAGA